MILSRIVFVNKIKENKTSFGSPAPMHSVVQFLSMWKLYLQWWQTGVF